MHIQDSHDSQNFAIHNAYHTLLRSSSKCEPRHPLLKVGIKTMTTRFENIANEHLDWMRPRKAWLVQDDIDLRNAHEQGSIKYIVLRGTHSERRSFV
jgi:hypothetical protein